MKLHPIIKSIMDEIQNLSELGGVESHEEYIYNLTFLELTIQESIKHAMQHSEEDNE